MRLNGKYCIKSGGTIRWGGPKQKGTKTKQIIIKGEILKYNDKIQLCSHCGKRYCCEIILFDRGLYYKQYKKKDQKSKIRYFNECINEY